MNVYEKLQECRIKLQSMKLKKSGKNAFAKYEYFELQDFLPQINQLFWEHKLCNIVKFDKEEAILEIVNIEEPGETIIFKSPMEKAELKGCHDIQNLGAVETYQRRYLYVMALEIVEHDVLDAVTGNEPKAKDKRVDEVPEGMKKKMFALVKEAGLTAESAKEIIKEKFGKDSSTKLTTEEMSQLLDYLENKKEEVA